MKSAAKPTSRRRKIILVKGTASQILAALNVGPTDIRRAKQALAEVARKDAGRKPSAAKRASKRVDVSR